MATRLVSRATKGGGTRGWNYGAFAFLLTLTTLFLNAFILTEYEALQPLFAPTMIIMMVGVWGLTMGFTVMTPRFGKFVLGLSFAVIVGILGILILSLVAGWFGSGSAFGILGVPSWVGVLFVGGIGVLETSFFQGLQAPIRRFWARDPPSILGVYVLMFIMGVAWHQAIARRLFQGAIYDTPGYALFVGGSWVLFAILFEVTRYIDVPIMAHWIWNVSIALSQGV